MVEKQEDFGYKSGPDKKLTYQDYLKMPWPPGCRYEILDGILIQESTPNVLHQIVSGRLSLILYDYFRSIDPKGKIFHGPLDVTLGDYTVVQPDLLYVAGVQRELMLDARIDGAPTLAIEILSPSTYCKDRVQKLHIYQRAGIQHYWIVNPDAQILECYALQDDVYALVAIEMQDSILVHPEFASLSIPLADLWMDYQ